MPNSCNYVGNTLKHASDNRQIQKWGDCKYDPNQYLHLCTDGNGNLYHRQASDIDFQYFCPSNNINSLPVGSIFWLDGAAYTVVDDSGILWNYVNGHFT